MIRLRSLALLAAFAAAGAAAVPYLPPVLPAARRGALLPWRRIVTYYGNPLSRKMGILGELPKDEMMAGLAREADVESLVLTHYGSGIPPDALSEEARRHFSGDCGVADDFLQLVVG